MSLMMQEVEVTQPHAHYGDKRFYSLINSTVYDRMKRNRVIMLIAGMLHDRMPLATIRFMIEVYDEFLSGKPVNCKILADVYKCSVQAANVHVTRLTEKNYLSRINYRAWEINSDYLLSLNPN
jgi:hypothetical protein